MEETENSELLNLEEIFFEEKIRPEIILLVQGTPVTFLCDSGACRTTLRDPIKYVTAGHKSVRVQAAQGMVKRVAETDPIWIRDPLGKSCQITVLLMPECPVNLLGRDGLIALSLALMPTDSGLCVTRMKPEENFVLQGVGPPKYYYTLDVPNKSPTKTGSHLLEEGIKATKKVEDKMSPDDLHVTMYYTNGPDEKYKAALDKVTPTTVTVTHLYYDDASSAAAAVALPDKIKYLFHQMWKPHISLCKSAKKEWKDSGRLVERGEGARDWEQTTTTTWYSKSTGLHKKALFWTTSVQASVHMTSKRT